MIDWLKYASNGSETAAQIALFGWAAEQVKYPELRWLFHVPNGGSRNKIEGARLKAAGVKPGVPDIFLPVLRKPHIGLWVELKRPDMKKSKVSDDQNDWLAYLSQQGYDTAVCYGFEMARNRIIQYLEG